MMAGPVVVAAMLAAVAVVPLDRPPRVDVTSTNGGFVDAGRRRADLQTCETACRATVRRCRPRAVPGPDRCGPARAVRLLAPPTGTRRRSLRFGRRRVVVTCRRATPTACAALAALPRDGVWDLVDSRGPGMGRLQRQTGDVFELTLVPDALSIVRLRGFAGSAGTLALRGAGVSGGDVVVTWSVRLAVIVAPDAIHLEGSLARDRGPEVPIGLVRPTPAPLPGIGSVLALDVERRDDVGGTLMLDLPIVVAPSGVATTGEADVVGAGGVVARVGPGDCLLSPTARVWCELPWTPHGSEPVHAWFAGTLDATVGDPVGNQVYVGAPPAVWSGAWTRR